MPQQHRQQSDGIMDIVPRMENLVPFIVDGATFRAYLGQLADAEARGLITRQFSLTKEEANAVDRVVASHSTLYDSHAEFVRHAVFELLMAYEQAGFPDSYVPDVTAHLRRLRQNAEMLKRRQDFAEALVTYEASLNGALEFGNFDYINDVLADLEGEIARTPDEFWKSHLKRTVLKSVVVKGAIDMLWEYDREHPTEGHGIRAERWFAWLEGLAE